MSRPSLTTLANKYGTDKGTKGPTRGWNCHNYTAVYETFFEHLRDQPLVLLEVGLGVRGEHWDARIALGRNSEGGASLRMWHEYFPKARIYGIDINPGSHLDNDRIRTFQADQGNQEQLSDVLADIPESHFDIIIDDGSHRPDHQQITFGVCFPRLKSGSHYFIEDLLSNGKGDNAEGRMACENVLNTRRVLQHWNRQGAFERPHAIPDPDGILKTIDDIRLAAPVTRVAKRLRRFGLQNLSWLHRVSPIPGSERLAIIRKRA